MPGAYQIIPIAQRTNINPGETAEIGIFITGSGEVDSAKLQALHTQDDLVEVESPGKIQYSVDYQRSDDDNHELILGDDALQGKEIDNWGTMAFITDAVFFTPDQVDTSGDVEMNDEEFQFQPIVGEAAHDGNPPLVLYLNIKSSAHPGDYEIPFVLTYGDEDRPSQSTATVDIHVQNWVERNRKILEILAILGTMALVISSIATAVASI